VLYPALTADTTGFWEKQEKTMFCHFLKGMEKIVGGKDITEAPTGYVCLRELFGMSSSPKWDWAAEGSVMVTMLRKHFRWSTPACMGTWDFFFRLTFQEGANRLYSTCGLGTGTGIYWAAAWLTATSVKSSG
jgi:hypothetical protein